MFVYTIEDIVGLIAFGIAVLLFLGLYAKRAIQSNAAQTETKKFFDNHTIKEGDVYSYLNQTSLGEYPEEVRVGRIFEAHGGTSVSYSYETTVYSSRISGVETIPLSDFKKILIMQNAKLVSKEPK